MNKNGNRFIKTKNIIKMERSLLKLRHKISNIRTNYNHQMTTKIIKQKPEFIVLEDLNICGIMKNKHLSKAIQEQNFYDIYRQIKYKCNFNGIKFIEANRYFASSKICCICGNVKHDLKLKDRDYVCDRCNNIINRDLQAAINLSNYGLRELAVI